MPGRVYNQLLQRAMTQHGFVTTGNAVEMGIDPHRLQKMKSRGLLLGVSRGVFRFPVFPPGQFDDLAKAVFWPNPVVGVLSASTALHLYDICAIQTQSIDITVPSGFRTTRQIPEWLSLNRRKLQQNQITEYNGLPIVAPAMAIAGAIKQKVDWHTLHQAISNARSTGLISREQADHLTSLARSSKRAA